MLALAHQHFFYRLLVTNCLLVWFRLVLWQEVTLLRRFHALLRWTEHCQFRVHRVLWWTCVHPWVVFVLIHLVPSRIWRIYPQIHGVELDLRVFAVVVAIPLILPLLINPKGLALNLVLLIVTAKIRHHRIDIHGFPISLLWGWGQSLSIILMKIGIRAINLKRLISLMHVPILVATFSL